MEQLKEYINEELTKLDRSFVATPDSEQLINLTKSNQGSMDEVLSQMAKQYGYKMALENTLDEVDKFTLEQKELNVLMVALEHMEEHLTSVQDEVDVSWQMDALETLKEKVLYTK